MSTTRNVNISDLAHKTLALLGNPNCGKTVLFNRL
jgi:predicted GTPase